MSEYVRDPDEPPRAREVCSWPLTPLHRIPEHLRRAEALLDLWGRWARDGRRAPNDWASTSAGPWDVHVRSHAALPQLAEEIELMDAIVARIRSGPVLWHGATILVVYVTHRGARPRQAKVLHISLATLRTRLTVIRTLVTDCLAGLNR